MMMEEMRLKSLDENVKTEHRKIDNDESIAFYEPNKFHSNTFSLIIQIDK